MTALHELSVVQLKQAIQIREQIDSLQGKLDALLGGSSSTAPKRKLGRPAGKKRTMSAATIEKMRTAQQARWAKIKGKPASRKSTPAKAAPKTKMMSPEAKAKIAAAMKARWAAKRKKSSAE